MATRTPLMAGNWKMNLDHLEATHLVQKLSWLLRDAGHDHSSVEVAVLPPATALRSVQTLVEADDLPVRTGGQDLSTEDSGARTGEVAGSMLARLGATYVCVGHSERREYHGEDDATVAAKAAAAHRNGLVPIVCVGEPLDVREASEHVAYTLAQLDGSLAGLDAEQVASSVVAYEPVWAIGTGKTCDAEDAQEVCGAIRQRIAATHGDAVADRVRVLYGGSVKPSNVAGIMSHPDIDGALVGGASLKAEDFAGIVRFREHPTA
ncbi:triose-phosphate isomerase [Jannaschia sp. R86511]|uniref:triose-phosphate isomerase n=1 Tax=Jannaschia sp. R86511 TaxID=3093853 RepID=UPI0036D388EA